MISSITRRVLTVAFVAGVAFWVACATLRYRHPDVSRALHFSHKKHAAEELECADCHGEVARSKGPTNGRFIPNKRTCGECHEVDQSCGRCHIGDEHRGRFTRTARKLKFSHASHGKKLVKQGCKACHPDVKKATKPGMARVPDMQRCAGKCHQKDLRAQRCTLCHQDLHRQRLLPVTSLGHQAGFAQRHGSLARGNAKSCASCHDQTHCANCHGKTAAMRASIRFPEKIKTRFIHRGDFLGRHAMLAREKPGTCLKCHGSKYCSSCHEFAGISQPPAKNSTSKSARNPHGPGWLDPTASEFHGRRARQDIVSCAACHDRGAASNCVTCHKVGAVGGNPHPRGFRWRNRESACRTNATCTVCHAGGTGC